MDKTALTSKNTILFALIVLGLAGGLIGVMRRYKVEARNKRVETVIDYADALNLALGARQPFDATLDKLHAAGITSLALAEDSLDNLKLNGAMTVLAVSPDETQLTFQAGFPGQEERVAAALRHKTSVKFTQTGSVLDVMAPYSEVNLLGIGLDPAQVATALRAGYAICPRLYNYAGVTPDAIQWMLQNAQAQCQGRATVAIFNGPDVLGNRALIPVTSGALAASHLEYGSIEFGKQIGDDILSCFAADHTVRVHSIGGNEMPTMEEPTAVGRFALAARERTIRVCYIRLFQNGLISQPNILTANTEFVGEVCRNIRDGGLTVAPGAHGYPDDPLPSRAVFALMALGAVAGGMLLLRRFTGIDGRAFWILLIVGSIFGIALTLPKSTPLGREALALIAAVAFPTLGLVRCKLPRANDAPLPFSPALTGALTAFAKITGWTLIGVAVVVGLLADRLFLLKVYEFSGIRVAVLLPLVLTLLYYGFELDEVPEENGWSERAARITTRWQTLMTSPFLIGQVILGVIGLALVAVLILRSGNDPGIGVSQTELGFRALLNKLLFVRPRTKEFLLGHPFLVLGLALALRGDRRWLLLGLCLGAIGQASLLNTFCHIHTPLFISMARAALGWVLGALFGAVLFAVAERWPRRAPLPRLDL